MNKKPRLIHKSHTLRCATGFNSLAEHDSLVRDFGSRIARESHYHGYTPEQRRKAAEDLFDARGNP